MTKKVTVFIMRDVPGGYGSPQFLYLKESLISIGLSAKIISPISPLEEMKGNMYYRNRITKYLIFTFLITKSFMSKICLIYNYESIFFRFLSNKTLLVNYNYEMLNDDQIINTSANIVRQRVRYLISPQEDRLNIAKKLYFNAKPFLVRNCPKQNEVVNLNKTGDFNILYQGQINDLSNARLIISLMSKLPDDFELHIAGRVDKKWEEKFLRMVNSCDRIHFYGQIPSIELADLRKRCCIGLITWGNQTPETMFAAPNKLFEYIADGMSVLYFENYAMQKLNEVYKFGIELDVAKTNSKFWDVMRLNSRSIGLKNYYLHVQELNYENQISHFMRELKSELVC